MVEYINRAPGYNGYSTFAPDYLSSGAAGTARDVFSADMTNQGMDALRARNPGRFAAGAADIAPNIIDGTGGVTLPPVAPETNVAADRQAAFLSHAYANPDTRRGGDYGDFTNEYDAKFAAHDKYEAMARQQFADQANYFLPNNDYLKGNEIYGSILRDEIPDPEGLRTNQSLYTTGNVLAQNNTPQPLTPAFATDDTGESTLGMSPPAQGDDNGYWQTQFNSLQDQINSFGNNQSAPASPPPAGSGQWQNPGGNYQEGSGSSWSTPWNNTSTFGPQYNANQGGARNGWNPTWGQSNPGKSRSF